MVFFFHGYKFLITFSINLSNLCVYFIICLFIFLFFSLFFLSFLSLSLSDGPNLSLLSVSSPKFFKKKTNQLLNLFHLVLI